MMKLITESNFDIKVEKDDKKLYITGLFSSAEKKNNNGRIYPKSILEREISKLQVGCKDKTVLGELSHPTERAETLFEKAAIMIEDLSWKGNDVYGKAKVLNTPNGFILRGLIKDGVKVGISSRGLGEVNEDGSVKDSLKLLTYDMVQNPSNIGSWVNGIYEGKEFNLIDVKKSELSEEEKREAEEYHYKKIMEFLNCLKG